MNSKSLAIVLVTAPDKNCGEMLAAKLLEARCAACINIIPGLHSIYRWKGQVESAEEVLLLIKSTTDRFTELELLIKASHPYENPEIIALNAEHAAASYLNWVTEETK